MPKPIVNGLRGLVEKSHTTEAEFLAALHRALSGDVLAVASLPEHQETILAGARVQIDPARALAMSNPFRPHWGVLLAALRATVIVILLFAVFFRWRMATVASLALVLAVVLGLVALGYLGRDHGNYLTDKVGTFFGAAPKTFAGEVLRMMESHRAKLWRERVHEINWELFDRGAEAFTWYALEEVVKAAERRGPRGRCAGRGDGPAVRAGSRPGAAWQRARPARL